MADRPKNNELILHYIREHIEIHGFSPSLREIASGCNLSVPTVNLCLNWLEGQGCISRQPKVARSIVVIDDAVR
jgi:SOS-response transcriptional repressor LexA